MTPHFQASELACKCGCGMLPERLFMDKVERLRMRAGFPMPVSSAARCPSHNAKVSSTGATGPHTTGRAIDLAVSGSRALELIRLALQMDFTGIGVNQKGSARFLHLDDLPNKDGQPRPHLWSYP
jgi:zinc D-Ala-D-Ala carboxypeptidase